MIIVKNIAAVEATLSETPLAEENIQTELSEEVVPATAQDVDRLTGTIAEEGHWCTSRRNRKSSNNGRRSRKSYFLVIILKLFS